MAKEIHIVTLPDGRTFEDKSDWNDPKVRATMEKVQRDGLHPALEKLMVEAGMLEPKREK